MLNYTHLLALRMLTQIHKLDRLWHGMYGKATKKTNRIFCETAARHWWI